MLAKGGTGVQYWVNDPHTGDWIRLILTFQEQAIVWAHSARYNDNRPYYGGTLFEYSDGKSKVTPGF